MKRLMVILLVVVALCSTSVYSQTTIVTEFYGLQLQEQEFVPTADIYVNSVIDSSRWSFTTFGLTTNSWAEVYAGFEYTIVNKPNNHFLRNLTLGFSVGIETFSPDYWRTAGSLYSELGDFTLTGCFEYGGSGYWFDAQVKYPATKWMKVGLIARRFHGYGIRMDFSIPKTPMNIWVAGLQNYGDVMGGPTDKAINGGALGLYFKF